MALITEEKYNSCWLCGSRMSLFIVGGLYRCGNYEECSLTNNLDFFIDTMSSSGRISEVSCESVYGDYVEMVLSFDSNTLKKTTYLNGGKQIIKQIDMKVNAESFDKEKFIKLFKDDVIGVFG